METADPEDRGGLSALAATIRAVLEDWVQELAALDEEEASCFSGHQTGL